MMKRMLVNQTKAAEPTFHGGLSGSMTGAGACPAGVENPV
jgi:hypothetical protein